MNFLATRIRTLEHGYLFLKGESLKFKCQIFLIGRESSWRNYRLRVFQDHTRSQCYNWAVAVSEQITQHLPSEKEQVILTLGHARSQSRYVGKKCWVEHRI